MVKASIFISDLHLGAGDELEDFIPENEEALVHFLEKQSENIANSDIDLVILGDGFDIWQVANTAEKTAANSNDISISITSHDECAKAKKIAKAHKKTFDALRRFLQKAENRKLYIVTGNHDHSLLDHCVKSEIRRSITGPNTSLALRVIFTDYYDNPELYTYAEHGNQFDVNNEYSVFSSFGEECPGYYFVRLFWNRLEHLEPNLDIWFKSFRLIWENKIWKLIVPAYRFFRQYRVDLRKFKRIDLPGVPYFAADGTTVSMPVTGETLPQFPDLLFSDASDPEFIFSKDIELENHLRTIYHDKHNAEFREAIEEILNEKFKGHPPTVPDAHPIPIEFGYRPDRYVNAVAGMFAPVNEAQKTQLMRGTALTQGIYRYVLLGHTHVYKQEKLNDLGVTYYNTGTWSVQRDENGKKKSELCYVIIEKDSNGTVTANQNIWKG